MMTVVAARALKNSDVCFVGIGAPSAACNLARLTHAPGITLIYESGTIGTKPERAAAVDRRRRAVRDGAHHRRRCRRCSATGCRAAASPSASSAARRSTASPISTPPWSAPYAKPKVRLPGGGGAPEIATSCARDLHHHGAGQARVRREARFHHLARPRHGGRAAASGSASRPRGRRASSPTVPDGAGPRDQGADGHGHASGRDARADHRLPPAGRSSSPRQVAETAPPTGQELEVLRELHARTKAAHQGNANVIDRHQ